MVMIRSHKDLVVWQKSIELAGKVYAASRGFPPDERWGLTSQTRRAAVSIASNIAEGASRAGRAEFLQYLHIARGSLSELETQITIAAEQGFLADPAALHCEIDQIGRLLNGLIRSLAQRSRQPQRVTGPVAPPTANRKPPTAS